LSVRIKKLKVEEGLKLFGPFVLLFVLGALIRRFYPCNWYTPDFFHVLADAFMVAGLIGASLELFSSKFLIEKVADDLASKLVGRGLPAELQSHIREITKTTFVRDHYLKEYRFSNPDEFHYMEVEMTVTFDVKNYSDTVCQYHPVIQEEIFFKPEFLYLEYGVAGEQPISFDAAKLAGLVKSDETTGVQMVEGPETIKLFPIREDDKAVCHVVLKYRLTLPEEYTDVTHFGGATIDATLRVQNIPQGFYFVSAHAEHTPDSSSWYFKGPFVQGQHVNAWWYRKKNPSDSRKWAEPTQP
jgi:hypothetical protein